MRGNSVLLAALTLGLLGLSGCPDIGKTCTNASECGSAMCLTKCCALPCQGGRDADGTVCAVAAYCDVYGACRCTNPAGRTNGGSSGSTTGSTSAGGTSSGGSSGGSGTAGTTGATTTGGTATTTGGSATTTGGSTTTTGGGTTTTGGGTTTTGGSTTTTGGSTTTTGGSTTTTGGSTTTTGGGTTTTGGGTTTTGGGTTTTGGSTTTSGGSTTTTGGETTTSGGSTTTTGGGTTTTGGTTAGGTTTGGGTTGGGLEDGSQCTDGSQCLSGICGVNGTGFCCTVSCATGDALCGATGCIEGPGGGACVYPAALTACGTTCTGSTLTQDLCDGAGACVAGTQTLCDPLRCGATGSCLTQCATLSDCTAGNYCLTGQCLVQEGAGLACGSNEACTSGVCGVSGSGNCCTATCDTSGDPQCAPTDCDNLGACGYKSNQVQCRSSGCTGDTLTEAAFCDGAGGCPAVVTTECTPYTCSGSATACATSCDSTTGNANCASGDFCDATNQVCCSGLAKGGTVAVDAATGSDATPCCGIGTAGPCQTLTHAMALIDAAQAQDVTILATVNGAGGDWTGETYPVVLGWGAELNAPGVFFLDPYGPNGEHNAETFHVGPASSSDTVGYASIVGTALSPVGLGMNSANSLQTDDVATLAVGTGSTLYIANALVNGSVDNPDSKQAVLVAAGAALVLGRDQPNSVTGTVTVGNALGAEATDGKRGIVCGTDGIGAGCTITDAILVGLSSVVIQGQETLDLDAEDFASIALTSAPVIGVPPSAVGFNNCPQKRDAIGSQAVLLNGQATVSLSSGMFQCLGGTAFLLQASPSGNGTPALSLDSSSIQNSEVGILVTAGTATVTHTTLNYNVIGVEQSQDGSGNIGSIDLSGGGNTIICSSNAETSQSYSLPGIDAYNLSTGNLNASNVAWDTANPDYFDCDATFACTCNLTACTAAAGSDDMDAVEDSTALGGITTTGASQSSAGCN